MADQRRASSCFVSLALVVSIWLGNGGEAVQAQTLEIHGTAFGASHGGYVPDEIDIVSSSGMDILGKAQVSDPFGPLGFIGGSQYIAIAGYGLLFSLSGAESEFGYGAGEEDAWSAAGTASWFDRFVIEPADPALLGTPGTFSYTLSVVGTGGVDEPRPSRLWGAFSQWAVEARFTNVDFGTIANRVQGTWGGDVGTPPWYAGDSPGSLLDFTVNFVFGSEIQTSATLQTLAKVATLEGKVKTWTAFNGVAWGGFTEVRSSQGLLLSAADFDVVSDSGFDWSHPHPVPEPSFALLIAMGGLALTCFAGNRHKRVR